MNQIFVSVVMLMAGMSWHCLAEEAESIAEQPAEVVEAAVEGEVEPVLEPQVVKKLPVALVAFGDVDDDLVNLAQEWSFENLAFPVPILTAEPQAQFATFDEVRQQASAMLEDNRLGIVVIWRPKSDIANHGAVYPEQRVAVVNLNPMFTDDVEPAVIENRVRRQVIIAICMVMGLEHSPNPLSVMHPYSSIEELDVLSRNLDMPWLQKLQEKAVAAGIELTPDSPFNLMQ